MSFNMYDPILNSLNSAALYVWSFLCYFIDGEEKTQGD